MEQSVYFAHFVGCVQAWLQKLYPCIQHGKENFSHFRVRLMVNCVQSVKT